MKNNDLKIGFFEQYLTIWVGACIILGLILGQFFGPIFEDLSSMTISNVNLPVALLVWMMIFPMMVQVNFSAIKDVGKNPKGLILTLAINWLIKPFTMALIAWIFFTMVFASYLTDLQIEQYMAGAILLGAAPCTAMVFVWSYLTKGDPEYTLVQVAINDLVLLVAFIPIVKFLLGVTNIEIPFATLFYSVFIFVVIPLVAGLITNRILINTKGQTWFESVFLPQLKPVSILALLSTLILLFAFQGETILSSPLHILIIAVPLTVQTYLIFFVSWYLGKKLKLTHKVLAPAAMIGASNFFELAVAVAIALFGLNSGAALATVVGVLIEVPVMLSLVKLANRWRFE